MYDSFSAGKMYYGRTFGLILGSIVLASLLSFVL